MRFLLSKLHASFLAGAVAIGLTSSPFLHAQVDAAAARSRVHDPGGDYVGSYSLMLWPVLMPAPTVASQTTKEDLAELHRLQDTRTPAQVKAAQADDGEEDLYVYRTVFGPWFSADKLPATNTLQTHVLSEAVNGASTLKNTYRRPRPYKIDETLHPVCGLTKGDNSYPSGHTMVGYLMALTLVEIVPEKQQEILKRADDYAHNRLVCGVHYPTDIESGRLASYLIFGEMMKSPKFVTDLQAARAELRGKLKLEPVQ